MKWFRFYSEVLHDSKVQTLGPDLFRAWVNLLCLANEGDERGHLPDMKQIAFALRIKEEKASQLIGQLTDCGLIDSDEIGRLRPHNWDTRQRYSDDVSNRVREHRRKKSPVSCNGNVTLHETSMKHDETPQRRGEERREERPPNPQGGAVCVSTNGSEPEPLSKALPSEPVNPPFDDAELTRVGQRAEKLFPMLDFGMKIRGIAGDGPSEFRLAWIDAALTEMHSGEVRSWRYLMGILKRYAADGGPKPTAQSGPRIHNPNPNPPPPPGGGYWRSPENQARFEAREAARKAQEAIAS